MTILWGSYKEFEGPWSRGTQRFTLSGTPTPEEEILAVITATEGGTYDAVNMYDVCLWTVGIIQWCNRAPQCSVDDMLGAAVRADPSCIKPLADLALERSYIPQWVNGRYRFARAGNVVDNVDAQKQLYFLNSSGLKGGWNPESKAWANRWAAAGMRVWESPLARKAQLDYTAKRAMSFAAGAGKTLLGQMPDTSIGRAWRAMYLSFAANNPKLAARAVEASVKDTAGIMPAWSESWLSNMAWSLTTNSGIAIYPIRYNKIRSVLEKMYGVDLPDYAKELGDWSAKNFSGRWYDVLEIQQALEVLGYDLGPEGCDGVMSARTTAALKSFEADSGVPADQQDGVLDAATADLLSAALEKKGVAALS